jgi:HAD superfamily hydrolase (TIGR01509 family)
MLKAVIFDMDGVIINSESAYHKVEMEIARSIGLPLSMDDFAQYEGIYLSTMWKELKEIYSLDVDTGVLIEREEAMMQEYYQHGNLEVIMETVDLIRRLHTEGMHCAIATSSITQSAQAVISRLNLTDYIRVLVTSSMVEKCKPFPDIFLKCVDMLGAAPEECIVIEDSKSGCLASKAAKIKVIGYRNPVSAKQDLSAADAIVDNTGEIDIAMINRLLLSSGI